VFGFVLLGVRKWTGNCPHRGRGCEYASTEKIQFSKRELLGSPVVRRICWCGPGILILAQSQLLMRKFGLFALLFLVMGGTSAAQSDSLVWYRKTVAMIPMRDGVKLFTVILSPMWAAGAAGPPGPSPILIQRTPYGADIPVPNDSVFVLPPGFPYYNMAKDGYIFVMQDVRGKYKSEGTMEIHQPLIHLTHPGAVDESTDTWDAVDWLIKNVPNNNGKAGITGVSYPGWLALVGAVDPHPSLKAASEQACMGDLFLGDDFHHNGAFRLSYGMEYSYEVEHDKTTDSDFPFPQFDLFDWYLRLGSLKHVNELYFHGTIPTWNNFVAHPS
jgi:uncharacterized protein